MDAEKGDGKPPPFGLSGFPHKDTAKKPIDKYKVGVCFLNGMLHQTGIIRTPSFTLMVCLGSSLIWLENANNTKKIPPAP